MYTAKSKINACVNDPDWPLDVYRYQRPMGPMTAWRLTAERWRKSHQWCVPAAVILCVHSSVLLWSACEVVHRQERACAVGPWTCRVALIGAMSTERTGVRFVVLVCFADSGEFWTSDFALSVKSPFAIVQVPS